MADAPQADTPNTPPRASRGRGNRGGPRTPRGGQEGRGRGSRGRGRGRGGGFAPRTNHSEISPSSPSAGNARPEGTADERLTDGTQADVSEGRGKLPVAAAAADADDDTEVCFICASPVEHQAVAPCNHRTCHVCSLRMRALYKNKACLHCRTSSDWVIFTDDPEKRYQDFQDSDFQTVHPGLGVKFEKEDIFEDSLVLLRYNCPDGECTVSCLGWPDLHRHVRSVHNKWMCDLCTRNKKVFTHEHELFTQAELRQHEKSGDDNPGAVDQTGFRGHPECGFCRQRFYGDDELYTHCRDKHEKCHICDRRDEGRRPQYYVDYNSLEQHFRKDHFVCPDRECLEKKFVVFGSEIDLKAHQIQDHPNGLTKDALRDARRVDLQQFSDLRERYQPGRGGRGGRGGGRDRREGREEERDGRGRGRGRDPNAEPLPASSAQPLGRAELAYQRQMAVQSSASIGGRTFGGALSAPSPAEAYAARGPEHGPASIRGPSRPTDSFPSVNSLGAALEPPTPSRTPRPDDHAELTPQEQARRMRHQAVVDRANTMLRGDQPKLAEFRTKVSHFKNSQATAAELVDSFFTLFDRPNAEIGSLVKELAEIFEINSKRDDLLKAWNDWKAIHEDYPSLPGSSSAASAFGSVGGKRVLKLKTSTAQSARSAAGVSRVAAGWNGTAGAAPSSSNLFPALPASRMNGGRANGAPKTPWAGATPAVSVAPAPRPVPSAARSTAPAPRADAFPALPAAAKPLSSALHPMRRPVLRNTPSGTPAGASPWGPPSASNGVVNGDEGLAQESGRRKGNKNKKQTIMQWG